jgi:DNA-binding NarL/FixJ family response regulator
MFRKGIVKNLLEHFPKAEVVDVPDGSDVIKLCSSRDFNVVLLDIVMPGTNGVDVLNFFNVNKFVNRPKIIVLSRYDDVNFIANLLKMGADGYLSKNCAFEEAKIAILGVLSGDIYVPELYERGITSILLKANLPPLLISKKDRQLVELISQGLSSKEISQKLQTPVRTIETQRIRLQKKVGVRNSSELMTFCFKNGLLSVERSDIKVSN